MEKSLAALAAYQISNFFQANGPTTQAECDDRAQSMTGQPATPTRLQGGSSYTVLAGNQVVQFRAPSAALDLDFLGHVHTAYAGFMPLPSDEGRLGELCVYSMQDVGGVSMYLARDSLYADGCSLLRRTLADFARFFASAWHQTPAALPQPDRAALQSTYLAQLQQLKAGLPPRFGSVLQHLTPRVKDITANNWPLVPNHGDLLENNIHVDARTGALTGVCDWADTQIGPFGMSVGEIENLLGIPKAANKQTARNEHAYHANHGELRALFYDELHRAIGGASPHDRERIEDARLLGLFFMYGWRFDGDGNQLPAREDDASLHHLDAVLRATCDGFH
ncbi:hypothetical protein B0T26DRAFT_644313 [Lasiosphaeria miniovina]|uniref:Aminoglycoside phosphotransferase domain-containing protein n=1 Tax=Lasiosphaeria miniovina TaxID=1954250 RepID=A0AA40AWT8_9PEZI|nr:uncharacterized protein B0T26DRAFT_644313 [Lasiosphaeria miniovina]KAK0723391.1 hypothetical protein B0T26DRAFT_644313 [Lasiosphaeria miniovina]